MTVAELTTQFPEIPADPHAEPILSEFARSFDSFLRTAAKPSACSTDRTPENQAYMKLIAPMDIYRYGLASKEKVIGQLTELVEAYAAAPDPFEDAMFERLPPS